MSDVADLLRRIDAARPYPLRLADEEMSLLRAYLTTPKPNPSPLASLGLAVHPFPLLKVTNADSQREHLEYVLKFNEAARIVPVTGPSVEGGGLADLSNIPLPPHVAPPNAEQLLEPPGPAGTSDDPPTDPNDIHGIITRDRQETAALMASRTRERVERERRDCVVHALTRLQQSSGSLSGLVDCLAETYAALDTAGQLGLLDQLPETGDARRIGLHLLRLAGNGQTEQCVQLLESVAPLGKVSHDLARELFDRMPRDLLRWAAQGPGNPNADPERSDNPPPGNSRAWDLAKQAIVDELLTVIPSEELPLSVRCLFDRLHTQGHSMDSLHKALEEMERKGLVWRSLKPVGGIPFLVDVVQPTRRLVDQQESHGARQEEAANVGRDDGQRLSDLQTPDVLSCPGCGSPPAAVDVDDVCPGCGAYCFLCGIIEHPTLPTEDTPSKVVAPQLRTPRWKRIPPSQVVLPAPVHAQESREAIPAGGPASAISPEADQDATAASSPKRMTAEEANKKAMELAKTDRFFVERSLREWAERIGCSEGLVPKLPLWQATMEKTGRGRRDKAPPPKAVSLTENLEAVTGEGDKDEVLNHLVAEQEADAEPSPLYDDPPDSRPRKVRSRKRL